MMHVQLSQIQRLLLQPQLSFKLASSMVSPEAFECYKIYQNLIKRKQLQLKDAIKFEYVQLCEGNQQNILSEDDSNIGEVNDKPGLKARIQQTNEQDAKYDMLNINQLIPLQNHQLCIYLKQNERSLKQRLINDYENSLSQHELICYTKCVIQKTLIKGNTLLNHIQQAALTGNVLLKYTQKPQQQQPKDNEDQKIEQSNVAKRVKAALSKYV
ncbi:unnamed protein product [Paramecium sonneborni]|uniref:Uncharacterized protein n=1 Tax=Paramecium sonneborni TaxID=65129 RepID=A0A8S1RLH8_9CILI|nr:unnamed protein product [Paramecium sonneborni]